jgi:hypothetical protein
MEYALSDRRYGLRLIQSALAATIVLTGFSIGKAQADESGISFWLPGQFSSLAATPQVPGWSMAAVYYHTSVEASGNVAAARQIQVGRFPANVNVNLNASLNAQADLVLLNPTYTFGTPVLGGQLAIGVTGIFGRANTGIDGTLTTVVGPLVSTRTGSISDSLTSVGDLYPTIPLAFQTSASVTPRSTAAVDTPFSIRRPARSFQRLQALPTISRITTRSIEAASISTSIGVSPSFSPSRFSSASSDTPISSSLTTPVRTLSSADSARAFSELDRSWDTSSRLATCKAT